MMTMFLRLIVAATAALAVAVPFAIHAAEGQKVVTVMTGTPVCTEDGVKAYAALHLVLQKAYLDSDSEASIQANTAMGDVQERMCHRVPCCDHVTGVLTGNTLKFPGIDDPFPEVIVHGRKGYILEEDILPNKDE